MDNIILRKVTESKVFDDMTFAQFFQFLIDSVPKSEEKDKILDFKRMTIAFSESTFNGKTSDRIHYSFSSDKKILFISMFGKKATFKIIQSCVDDHVEFFFITQILDTGNNRNKKKDCYIVISSAKIDKVTMLRCDAKIKDALSNESIKIKNITDSMKKQDLSDELRCVLRAFLSEVKLEEMVKLKFFLMQKNLLEEIRSAAKEKLDAVLDKIKNNSIAHSIQSLLKNKKLDEFPSINLFISNNNFTIENQGNIFIVSKSNNFAQFWMFKKFCENTFKYDACKDKKEFDDTRYLKSQNHNPHIAHLIDFKSTIKNLLSEVYYQKVTSFRKLKGGKEVKSEKNGDPYTTNPLPEIIFKDCECKDVKNTFIVNGVEVKTKKTDDKISKE